MRRIFKYVFVSIVIVSVFVVLFERELAYTVFGFCYESPVEYPGFTVQVPKSMRYKRYENSSTFFYLFDRRYAEIGQKGNRKFSINGVIDELTSKGVVYEYVKEDVNGYDVAMFTLDTENGKFPNYIYYFLGTNVYMMLYGEGGGHQGLDFLIRNISISVPQPEDP